MTRSDDNHTHTRTRTRTRIHTYTTTLTCRHRHAHTQTHILSTCMHSPLTHTYAHTHTLTMVSWFTLGCRQWKVTCRFTLHSGCASDHHCPTHSSSVRPACASSKEQQLSTVSTHAGVILYVWDQVNMLNGSVTCKFAVSPTCPLQYTHSEYILRTLSQVN